MNHKNLQNLVCFEIFKDKPTLDELNDRYIILNKAAKSLAWGFSLVGLIIAWGHL